MKRKNSILFFCMMLVLSSSSNAYQILWSSQLFKPKRFYGYNPYQQYNRYRHKSWRSRFYKTRFWEKRYRRRYKKRTKTRSRKKTTTKAHHRREHHKCAHPRCKHHKCKIHKLPDLFPLLKRCECEDREITKECCICYEDIPAEQFGLLGCCETGKEICDECVKKYVCAKQYSIEKDESGSNSGHPAGVNYCDSAEKKWKKYQKATPAKNPEFLWFEVGGKALFLDLDEEERTIWRFVGNTNRKTTSNWRSVALPRCPGCRTQIIAQIMRPGEKVPLTKSLLLEFLQSHGRLTTTYH